MKDQAEKVYDGTYEKIVSERSLYEHTKGVSEKIEDIFQHTDRKVHEVMRQIVDCYNCQASNNVDPRTNAELQKILENNIAFAIGYEEPISLA